MGGPLSGLKSIVVRDTRVMWKHFPVPCTLFVLGTVGQAPDGGSAFREPNRLAKDATRLRMGLPETTG